MSTHPAPALGTLAPRLTELSLRDAHRLGRRLEGARKIRKPEPYKGKGIRYAGEKIRRKAGKAGKVGGKKK